MNMAEALTIVGAVASTVQLMDFTAKLFERLNDYIRHVEEVPESVRGIRLHLPLFIEALRRTQFHIDHGHYNPTTSAALKIFIDECNTQMLLLQDILTSVTPIRGDSRILRSQKAICSLKQEKSLKKIHSSLSGYIEKLLLFQTTVISGQNMVRMKSILHELDDAAFRKTHSTSVPTDDLTINRQKTTTSRSMSQNLSKSLSRYYKNKNQYRISSFLGLSRFGLLWAFQASLDLSWGRYGFSITPSLQIRQLVKHTSPGFEVFWKCQTERLDIESARAALFELFCTGKASPTDVDPQGRTWLEVNSISDSITKTASAFVDLIKRILHFRSAHNVDMEIAFLKMLVKWDAPMNTKTSWSGFRPHLTLLKELIALDYDLSADEFSSSSMFLEFPFTEPLYGFPEAYTDMPDPFLLKLFVECAKSAYGVWGQTPLMDAILVGSTVDITRILQTRQFLQDRNVLGQTPIHLAVLRPRVLVDILELWPCFDIQDNSGKTPLDYAASYGYVESIKALLNVGLHQINAQHLEFLNMARAWRHWNVITETLAFLRAAACFSENFLQRQIDQLVTTYLHLPWQSRPEDFKILIELGTSPHMFFENGDTLLHRLWHEKQVATLFDFGYHNVDHPNLEGRTALMASISRCDCVLYDSILTRGCNVNHRDSHGLTALHMACRKLNRAGSIYSEDPSFILKCVSKNIVLIAKILHHGADPLSHDNCRCPCSPDGCSPSTKLLLPWSPQNSTGSIWVLEWLLILKKSRGEATAQRVLLELIRISEFEKAGMTHRCCQRGANTPGSIAEDEVDEILDEERHFVSQLNDTMRHAKAYEGSEVEESWLKLLSNFYKPQTECQHMKWTWATWKGGSSSLNNQPDPHPMAFNGCTWSR
ncbi:hypothetical protein N7492_004857 [Penicillium capsulatum]|uniref:NACHT-NTPase and P-loop NTPases N-terminal domain-containing protein n=1 Tax=Penicillium capsulatum TaxID=69766 RepID=A0A9W9IAM0_9EURO|nr:hypothetical protein N7492_004857 [Penicillium capsulatum]